MRFVIASLAVVVCGACGGSPPLHQGPAYGPDPEPRALTAVEPELTMPTCNDVALTPSESDPMLASIERTGCGSGMCPAYRVSVSRSGLVQYIGVNNVLTCTGTAQLDPEQLRALEEVFGDATYLSLEDEYASPGADVPSVMTSFSPSPGMTKRIAHHHGGHKTPKVLGALEDAIDRILDIEHFIGTEEQRMRAWRKHGD